MTTLAAVDTHLFLSHDCELVEDLGANCSMYDMAPRLSQLNPTQQNVQRQFWWTDETKNT